MIDASFGCTNPEACNFSATAQSDDGTCFFPEDEGWCDCNGSTVSPGECDCEGNVLDSCGVCGGDGSTCLGCTDLSACNYNPDALIDDGTCLQDDVCGVCGGPGAIYDCGCADLLPGTCDCDGNVKDECGVAMACIVAPACDCEGNVEDDCVCDGNGIMFGLHRRIGNFDPSALIDDGSCELILARVALISMGNYDPAAAIDDGSCEFDLHGLPDATACNYDPAAVIDDGSCEFDSCAGCTDATACNYDRLR